jgi:hypothetical protein
MSNGGNGSVGIGVPHRPDSLNEGFFRSSLGAVSEDGDAEADEAYRIRRASPEHVPGISNPTSAEYEWVIQKPQAGPPSPLGRLPGLDSVCQRCARLQEDSKLPFDPLKGLKFDSQTQPDGGQTQPVVDANSVSSAPSVESEPIGSSLWVETEEDQKVVDKFRKEAEL